MSIHSLGMRSNLHMPLPIAIRILLKPSARPHATAGTGASARLSPTADPPVGGRECLHRLCSADAELQARQRAVAWRRGWTQLLRSLAWTAGRPGAAVPLERHQVRRPQAARLGFVRQGGQVAHRKQAGRPEQHLIINKSLIFL